MDGRLVDAVPPRRWEKSLIDWDEKADLARENPDMAVLAATHISLSRIKSVRSYTRPPFIRTDGRIKVHMRNSVIEDDGERYGDVFFVWVPAKKSKK